MIVGVEQSLMAKVCTSRELELGFEIFIDFVV